LDNLHPATELTKNWTKAMPAVAAFVRSRINRFHDAEDILQEVASDVVAQFGEFDASRSFTDWALGIARNKLKLHYRQAATGKRVLGNLAMTKIAEAMGQVNEDSSEVAEALGRCLKTVDSRSRELLNLRYVHDLSCSEIASQKSATTNAVRVALHRLRTALHRCIEERVVARRGMA
jgi:RNA polymerase sigma-70 factor (ECF subfamily)